MICTTTIIADLFSEHIRPNNLQTTQKLLGTKPHDSIKTDIEVCMTYTEQNKTAQFIFFLKSSANFEVKCTDIQSQGINITDQTTSLRGGVA